MRYTVTWKDAALDRLADLWATSNQRGSFASAVNLIEHALQDDPASKGGDLYGDHYLVVEPLMVTFKIEEDDRVVEIIDVWSR